MYTVHIVVDHQYANTKKAKQFLLVYSQAEKA